MHYYCISNRRFVYSNALTGTQFLSLVLITRVPVMSHLWLDECIEIFFKKYFYGIAPPFKNKFIFYNIIIQLLSQCQSEIILSNYE